LPFVVKPSLLSTGTLFLYKSAKMLRTKKDLHMAAASTPSLLGKPKGKESLA
jgi:hypothetical protein